MDLFKRSTIDGDVANALDLAALYRAEAVCFVADHETARGFRKKLYLRYLALTSYETALALRELLGPKFRDAVSAELRSAELAQLKQIHSEVCLVFNELRAEMGTVRNGVIAHKSRDAELRKLLMQEVNSKKVEEICLRLLVLLKPISTIIRPYVEAKGLVLSELMDALNSDEKLMSLPALN
jgi:hypothetical protein